MISLIMLEFIYISIPLYNTFINSSYFGCIHVPVSRVVMD